VNNFFSIFIEVCESYVLCNDAHVNKLTGL